MEVDVNIVDIVAKYYPSCAFDTAVTTTTTLYGSDKSLCRSMLSDPPQLGTQNMVPICALHKEHSTTTTTTKKRQTTTRKVVYLNINTWCDDNFSEEMENFAVI